MAEHIRPEQLLASRFHVLTRSLPLAIDRPADAPVTRRRTPAFIAGASLVGVVALFAALVLGNALLPRATATLIAGGGTATPSVAPSSLPSTAGAPTPSGSVLPSGPTASPSIGPSPTPPPSPSPSPAPTPSVAPTATPEPTVHRYRVRRGDTLQKIANRFGTTVRALVEINHLKDAADIKVGQNLIIP